MDDATAAKLLRAAQVDRRMLVGVTVEFLLRTGLRVGEYTALTAMKDSKTAEELDRASDEVHAAVDAFARKCLPQVASGN